MTRLGVATALVALCCVAVAQADVQPVPAGFTANTALSRAASFIAGKQVTDYCATSQQRFDDADEAATGNPGGAAYSYIGGTQSFLSPPVCVYLARWNAKKMVTVDHFAQALLALTHEAELLTGTSDESIADCHALAVMPSVIQRFFPLAKRTTLHVVMRDAWDAHDGQPEPYLENCPQR